MEEVESTTEHGFLPGTTVAPCGCLTGDIHLSSPPSPRRAYSLTSPDADPGGDASGCAWCPLCLDRESLSPAFCASASSVFPPPSSMWFLPADFRTDCFEMSPANTSPCHKRAQACQAACRVAVAAERPTAKWLYAASNTSKATLTHGTGFAFSTSNGLAAVETWTS
jgi:hypothetical protein